MQTTINDEEKQVLLVSNSNSVCSYKSLSPTENELSTDVKSGGLSFKRLPGRKKIVFLVIGMVNFCACTCFSLLAPFFPAEAKLKGTSQTVIGLIFSSFEFWIFISSPIFGFFLTRIGAKFMFISGVIVCGICSILFGVLDKCPPGEIFIVMCFLCRTVEALGCSAFITASFAIIAHEFPDNVATVFGSLETFSGIGMMVGPPIGGALYELGGYGLPFWTLGGILIICGSISFTLMPSQDESRKPFQGSILSLLRSPLVAVTCLAIFSGSFSLGFLDPTLAEHLAPFKLGTLYVGLIFLCAPGVYGFTAPIWGYLGDTKGWTGSMMALGVISSAVTFFLLGPAPFFSFLPFELWLIIVSLCLLGLTVGCALIPTFKSLLIGAKQLGLDESLNTFGMVSGIFNSSFSLGAFIGPSFGGFLQEKYGFDWATTGCAFLYIICGIVILLYMWFSKQGFKEPKQPPLENK